MLDQLHFTATLILRSDLHIGTAEIGLLGGVEGLRPDASLEPNVNPEVSVIFRANDKKPAIPASAIKGALRKALIERHDETEAKRLFGAIKTTEWPDAPSDDTPVDNGKVGTVWLRLSKLKENPDLPGELPYWVAGQSTYISAHVAIARKTGTADDQKLYYVERVPEGAKFELRGVVIGEVEHAKHDLELALAPLASGDGLSIGADQRFAGGRIQLAKDVSCTRHCFDAVTGEIEIRKFRHQIPRIGPVAAHLKLILECPGPYVTIDPAKKRRGDNRIPAAKRSEQVPSLQAKSVMGILRSRAAWLAEVQAALNGTAPCAPLDNPYRKQGKTSAAQGEVEQTWEDVADLAPVERLFGVSGWGGLVRLIDITPLGSPRRETLFSVGIDRFTGGPLDSVLFEIECFVGASFSATVALDTRGNWPSDADRALFAALIADLTDDGMVLGYGGNRGFGWFSVRQEQTEGQAA